MPCLKWYRRILESALSPPWWSSSAHRSPNASSRCFLPNDAAAPLLGGVVQILFRNVHRLYWMIDLRPVIAIVPQFSNLVLIVERKVRLKLNKQTDGCKSCSFFMTHMQKRPSFPKVMYFRDIHATPPCIGIIYKSSPSRHLHSWWSPLWYFRRASSASWFSACAQFFSPLETTSVAKAYLSFLILVYFQFIFNLVF